MVSTARASSSIARPSTAMPLRSVVPPAGHRGARTIEQSDRPCEEEHAALVVFAARERRHDLRHPGLQGSLRDDQGVDRGHVARQRLIEDAAREGLRVLGGLGLGCDRVHLPEVGRDCGRIGGGPRAVLRPRRWAGARSGVRPGTAYVVVFGRGRRRGGRDAAKQECHGHHPKGTATDQQPDDPARQRDGGHDSMVPAAYASGGSRVCQSVACS